MTKVDCAHVLHDFPIVHPSPASLENPQGRDNREPRFAAHQLWLLPLVGLALRKLLIQKGDYQFLGWQSPLRKQSALVQQDLQTPVHPCR